MAEVTDEDRKAAAVWAAVFFRDESDALMARTGFECAHAIQRARAEKAEAKVTDLSHLLGDVAYQTSNDCLCGHSAQDCDRGAASCVGQHIRDRHNEWPRYTKDAETIELAQTTNARLRAERDCLREALQLDTPLPLTTVLVRLADACEHLLDDHDCDGDGHEGVRVAIASARESTRALLSDTGGADG